MQENPSFYTDRVGSACGAMRGHLDAVLTELTLLRTAVFNHIPGPDKVSSSPAAWMLVTAVTDLQIALMNERNRLVTLEMMASVAKTAAEPKASPDHGR